MVVLNVVNCPQQLRGDLTKWMLEINTGVYVGKLNAKVREEIWQRVCDNIKNGQATMVYSCNNEQGYGFYTHNMTWKPVDYDGITLIKKYALLGDESRNTDTGGLKKGFSKAAKHRLLSVGRRIKEPEYVVIDLETTGLDPSVDKIIEVGLVHVKQGVIVNQYHCYVNTTRNISDEIKKLTGITNQILEKEGMTEEKAFEDTMRFIEQKEIVGYNTKFDISFLEALGSRMNQDLAITKCKDIMDIARRKIKGLENYKLKTVADYFACDTTTMHRALQDCMLIHKVYEELNKM